MKQKILIISILFFNLTTVFSQLKTAKIFITDKNGLEYYIKTIDDHYVKEKNVNFSNSFKEKLLIIWDNDDYDISKHEDADSRHPDLDIGYDGTLCIVYCDRITPTSEKILFSKKEPQGEWTSPIVIDIGGIIGERNNHRPAVAISPNGNIHVIYNVWAFENTRHFIGYSFYDASEDTWNDAVELSTAGGSVSNGEIYHDIYSTDNNLPVVIWGFDNRENSEIEEVYMKYYNGTVWSGDIIVSTPSDLQSATFPYIESIGDNKAIIIFDEKTNTGKREIRYRIYDESTHNLSDIKTVPYTTFNIGLKYDIAKTDNQNALIALVHQSSDTPWRDTIKCINYNIITDEFTLSDHKHVTYNNGPGTKEIAIDCDLFGNCAVIWADVLAKTCNHIGFNQETGFNNLQIFNNEDVFLDDKPRCKFDNSGNIHAVWGDLRFDTPGGYVEREIFYEMGTNSGNLYTVTFTVDDGTNPIENAEIIINGETITTVNSGIASINLADGDYDYIVTATGYETYSETVIVDHADKDVAVNLIPLVIDELTTAGISVYPNPSNRVFNIDVKSNFNLEVFDITGKILNTQVITESSTIELNTAGMYFFRFKNEKNTLLQKVIVK